MIAQTELRMIQRAQGMAAAIAGEVWEIPDDLPDLAGGESPLDRCARILPMVQAQLAPEADAVIIGAGVIGAALEDQKSWCGIIVDGRHVATAALNIAFRARPLEKFILVTDAMPTVGMKEKAFTLQGRKITVKDGVCITEEGTLAGSDLEMTRAVRNCAAFESVGLANAVNMATINPAAFLGLGRDIGRIAPGYRANLIAVDDDLTVLESWIDGAPTAALENDALPAAARR